MISNRSDLLKYVRSLLAYHENLGIRDYFVSEDVSRFVSELYPAGTVPDQQVAAVQNDKKLTKTLATDTLIELRDEIGRCRACGLAEKRMCSVAGRGGGQAKLLIIGEWLSLAAGEKPGGGALFGQQEDIMLSRMISAINLEPEEVFVTNLIKCGLSASTIPRQADYQACLPYLHRQIALVQPDVICAMGGNVSKLLLSSDLSLSQLRGRFYSYTAMDSRDIPMRVTYHPTYLLKNTEMKKLTWEDLQAISRKLGEKRTTPRR